MTTFPLHPSVVLAAELAAITLLVGFTAPSSLLRFAVLPVLSAAVWVSIPTCLRYLHRNWLASLVAGQQATFVLQYIEVVLVSRWAFKAGGPTYTAAATASASTPKTAASNIQPRSLKAVPRDTAAVLAATARKPQPQSAQWLERLAFGWTACISARHCGTPLEVPNVPHFTSAGDGAHATPPSRGVYVRGALMRVAVCYFVLDLLDLGARPEQNHVLFAPALVPLFARLFRRDRHHLHGAHDAGAGVVIDGVANVTAEQLVVRVSSTLGCIVGTYCVINLCWSLLAAAVRFCARRIHFAPLLGLRSVFWHQFNRQKLLGPARFFVHSVLRLPRKSPLSRVVTLWTTFLLSGILHLSTDAAIGIFFPQSGALAFFALQPLGILLEAGVAASYGALRRRGGDAGAKGGDGDGMRWTKAVGYVWVVLWLAWTAPRWIYPSLCQFEGTPKDLVVPFSIVKKLKF